MGESFVGRKIIEKAKDWVLDSSPVILMGRGGSGTRMLSHFLRSDLKFFLGNKINNSGDSTEWKSLTFKIAKEYASQIDLPEDPDIFEEEIVNLVKEVFKKEKNPDRWGWKMPQTLLIFPIYAKMIPNSKFIHMIRHPVPASIGIKRRNDKTSRLRTNGKNLLLAAYAYSHHEKDLPETKKLQNLSSCSFTLQVMLNAYGWNHQIERAIEYGRENLKNRYLEIKYEDCCDNPQKQLERICEFLQIEEVPKTTLKIKKSLSPSNLEELKGHENKKSPRRSSLDSLLTTKNRGKIELAVREICEETAKKIGYEL